jgi:hypothetical protein
VSEAVMQKISISRLVLGFMVMVFSFPLEATQVSKGPSAEALKNLSELKPTLEQIRNVDSKKVPWGINICLLEERGNKARQLTIDNHDFSSRVTLLQKHKNIAQRLSQQMAELAEKIKNKIQETKTKIDSLSFTEKLRHKSEIEAESKEIVDGMEAEKAKLVRDLANNATMIKNFANTIKSKMGLTDDEINAIPDLEKWKEMRKTQCVTPGNLRPLPKLPEANPPLEKPADTVQTVPWQRGVIPKN